MALTAAEQKELDSLNAENAAPKGGLTPDEQKELDSLQASNPAPTSITDSLKKGMQVLGKGANVLWGTTTGPLAGLGLEAASGKPVFKGQDIANTLNPTNLKTFPSLGEMAARAGVPEGGKLSDILSGYAEKGSNHPFYQPEKGGMLDPTLRGTGAMGLQMALDPAMYLPGLQEARLVEGGAGQILKGASRIPAPLQAASEALTMPARTIAKGIDMVPGSEVLGTITNPIGTMLQKSGKFSYSAPLIPIAHEGEKFGKQGINETMYQAGIANPYNLQAKAKEAMNTLGKAQGDILNKAEAAGGVGSMNEAVQPALEAIQKIRSGSATPEAQALADTLEEGVRGYVARERGLPAGPATPAVPASYRQVPSDILDESGQPFLKQELASPGRPALPGTPAQPGIASTPSRLSSEKTWLYNEDLPPNAYNTAMASSAGEKVQKQLARGLKEQTEKVVGQTLSPEAEAALKDINQAYGGLAATQKTQRQVQFHAQKQLHNLPGMSGIDAALLGAGSAAKSADVGLLSVILKKLVQAGQMGAMPGAYYTRKLGESHLVDRILQQQNPWSNLNSNDEGK